MGTYTGAQFINDVARRLRDTSNTGYPRATVLTFLNACQDLINVRLALTTATTTVTTSNTAIYQLPTTTPRILTVRDTDSRELANVSWDWLVAQNVDWLRSFGQRAEIWSQVGRDLLILTPIPEVATALTVVYAPYPTQLADDAVAWTLPDEHKSLLTDLTCGVLLFRAREFNAMQDAINRVAPKLGMEDAAQILRRGGMGRTN